MPRKRRSKFSSYTPDFRARVVSAVRAGMSQNAAASKFGVSSVTIRAWCLAAGRAESKRTETSSASEMGRLRSDNARLRSTIVSMTLERYN